MDASVAQAVAARLRRLRQRQTDSLLYMFGMAPQKQQPVAPN
ncbi:MAG TPA: hypothetical protein PKZ84_00980 [Anaerolineae bacterium]|nr:hypothetical protein [Anaerolineae bacterium]HQI82973.1 hypothetical protein [Anaerolineae bacterium]